MSDEISPRPETEFLSIDSLIGNAELVGFSLVQGFEVLPNVDADNRQTEGLFKDEGIANAYAKQLGKENNARYQVNPCVALTNGVFYLPLRSKFPSPVREDEVERLKLKEKLIATLSPEQRVVLGF